MDLNSSHEIDESVISAEAHMGHAWQLTTIRIVGLKSQECMENAKWFEENLKDLKWK